MSGYVLHKPKKKRHALDGLIQKDQEYITETSSNEWIKLIDRGGLVHVTEECHQLFVSIELITRHHIRSYILLMSSQWMNSSGSTFSI